jgi:uncharacterized membrane protein
MAYIAASVAWFLDATALTVSVLIAWAHCPSLLRTLISMTYSLMMTGQIVHEIPTALFNS